MKRRSFSLVAIAALFAIGSAFTSKLQVQNWNVDHPYSGQPGIYWLTYTQVKGIYCPGLDNVECAYLIGSPINIVKKPY